MTRAGVAVSNSVFRFLGGYLVTMRPYLLFLSGVTGIAGMAYGSADQGWRHATIFAACFLSYGFGQALTDCFQTDTDSISSPYRPLTRGALPLRPTLAVSIAGLCASVATLGAWNPLNVGLGVLAGAGLATYTWFKRRWWGGPWYNSWIVLVLFLMAALASGWTPSALTPSFAWTAAGTFFAYGNFVLAGYFKDTGADRATGYVTLPVRFGRRRAAFASDCLAAGLGASLAGVATTAGFRTGPEGAGWLFLAGSAAAIVAGQRNLHLNRTDATAHRAVVPVLHSYVTFLAGAATLRRPGWFLPLAAFYAAFCLVMARRPERGQV